MMTQYPRLEKLKPVLACPACGGDVSFNHDAVICEKCKSRYPVRKGKIYFTEVPERVEELDKLKGFLKKNLGKYYYSIGLKIIAPDYPSGFRKKIRQYTDPSKNIVIDVGCGNQRIDEEIICLDLFDYDVVDIVCDLESLPFKSESIDAFVSQSVLEHLPDPVEVVHGFSRCTKKGGIGVHLVPFLYPFHSSPYDFQRYTHQGMAVLFKDFDVIEQTNATGPVTLFLVCIIEFLSALFSFGQEKIKGYIYLALCGILFPIKFLDFPFVNKKKFIAMAPTIFSILRKE